jgi:hypothetical protein
VPEPEPQLGSGSGLLQSPDLDPNLDSDPGSDGPQVCIQIVPPPPECAGNGPGINPPVDPCEQNPLAEGCVLQPQPQPPDDDCLYDPSLPKRAPVNGKCPPAFSMNTNGQCYPDKPCPPGFARMDNDEPGACLPVDSSLLASAERGGDCDPPYPGGCIPSHQISIVAIYPLEVSKL